MNREKNLWKRYKSYSPADAGQCPDHMDIAALAEGRLGRRNRKSMYLHLSNCDDCLDMYIALREQLAAEQKASGGFNINYAVAKLRDWYSLHTAPGFVPAAGAATLIIVFAATTGFHTFNHQHFSSNALSASMNFEVDQITFPEEYEP